MSVWKKYTRPLLLFSVLLFISLIFFSYSDVMLSSKMNIKSHVNRSSLVETRTLLDSSKINIFGNEIKRSADQGDNLEINSEKIKNIFQRRNLTPPIDTLKKLQILSKSLKENSAGKLQKAADKWKTFHYTVNDKIKEVGRNYSAQQDFLTKTTIVTDKSTDERPESCESCFKNNFKILINEAAYCEQFKDLDLVIVIATALESDKERLTIRETWGKLCTTKNKLACVFTLGTSDDPTLRQNLLSESKKYRDIIQFDFKDSYSNLTYKTMSSFRWVTTYCPGAKYIMKTDGDMYINTENLPTMLSSGAPRTKFMGGYCWVSTTPKRNTDSKWYVSFKSYAKSKFPPMCSGTGYILSIDAVHKLLSISRNIPYFHLEDVYVAICMQKLHIRPVNLQGFSNMKTPFYACTYRNSIFTSHYVDTNSLETYWKQSRKCPKDQRSPENLYRALPLHIP